jgi:hypothetical protein
LGSGPTCADGCAATIDFQAATARDLQSGAGANDARECECSRFTIEATSLLVRWEPSRPRYAYLLGKKSRFYADRRFYGSRERCQSPLEHLRQLRRFPGTCRAGWGELPYRFSAQWDPFRGSSDVLFHATDFGGRRNAYRHFTRVPGITRLYPAPSGDCSSDLPTREIGHSCPRVLLVRHVNACRRRSFFLTLS